VEILADDKNMKAKVSRIHFAKPFFNTSKAISYVFFKYTQRVKIHVGRIITLFDDNDSQLNDPLIYHFLLSNTFNVLCREIASGSIGIGRGNILARGSALYGDYRSRVFVVITNVTNDTLSATT